MHIGLDVTLRALDANRPAVLIICQPDAVSPVMDRMSQRMRLLLRLVADLHRTGDPDELRLPVRVLVSSRPFEVDHDSRSPPD